MRPYFIILLVCMFSCDQNIPYDTGGKVQKKDGQQLFVTATTFDGKIPALIAEVLPVNTTEVKVYFNKLISVPTVKDEYVSFVEENTGKDIKMDLKIVENDSDVIVFNIPRLTYGRKYTLSISEKIVSREGYALTAGYVKEYESDPPPLSTNNTLVVLYNKEKVPYSITSGEFEIFTDAITDISNISVTLKVPERASLEKDGQQIALSNGEHTVTLDFSSSSHSYTVTAEDKSKALYTISAKQFFVFSSSFVTGGQLGARYSLSVSIGAGSPTSPQLSWKYAQIKTQSYIILCWDEDKTTNNNYWLVVDIPRRVNSIAESGLVGRSLTTYQGILLRTGQKHSIHFTVFSLEEPTIPKALDNSDILAPQLIAYARKRIANVGSDPPISPTGMTIMGMADAQVFYTQQ